MHVDNLHAKVEKRLITRCVHKHLSQGVIHRMDIEVAVAFRGLDKGVFIVNLNINRDHVTFAHWVTFQADSPFGNRTSSSSMTPFSRSSYKQRGRFTQSSFVRGHEMLSQSPSS